MVFTVQSVNETKFTITVICQEVIHRVSRKKNASLKLSLGAKSHKELRCHYASLTVVSRMMKQSFCLTDTIPLQADVSRSQSSNLSRGNFIDSYICIFPTVVANIPSDSRDVYEKVLTI